MACKRQKHYRKEVFEGGLRNNQVDGGRTRDVESKGDAGGEKNKRGAKTNAHSSNLILVVVSNNFCLAEV